MTTKEQKEAIRQACIKANPSILDLKFGCKLRLCVGGITEIFTYIKDTPKRFYLLNYRKQILHRSIAKEVLLKSDKKWTNYEILGRDIHLADVLFAVNHSDKQRGFFVNEYGIFFRMIDEIRNPNSLDPLIVKYKHLGWNLLKDTLDEQSPETIEFIYNLIK